MPDIELAQPQAQYTPGNEYALVQFAWRTAATDTDPAGDWNRASYSPTQAQLSSLAPADVLAVAPGYWSDAEVRANVVAWIAARYGFTTVSFLAAGAS